MELGESGLVGGEAVDNVGLAANAPGDKTTVEVIEFAEMPDV